MTTKTKIDWPWKPLYTWNPVIGCRHGCKYCYARRMNNRFKWIPKWEEPKFFENKLAEPYKIKKPSKIFVCSIADLFGDWIPEKWINKIIEITKDCPQHTFQFLTKNPKRYLGFDFPQNCWLGTTVDVINQARVNYLKEKRDNYKFISFEPLLGSMGLLDLSEIDLVIIGAMTGAGAIKPKKEWIYSIKHNNIFYKSNIQKYL